jgi:hypothetical protein
VQVGWLDDDSRSLVIRRAAVPAPRCWCVSGRLARPTTDHHFFRHYQQTTLLFSMLALTTARTSLRQSSASLGRRSYAQVDTRSFYTKYGAWLVRHLTC